VEWLVVIIHDRKLWFGFDPFYETACLGVLNSLAHELSNGLIPPLPLLLSTSCKTIFMPPLVCNIVLCHVGRAYVPETLWCISIAHIRKTEKYFFYFFYFFYEKVIKS
jgi:hypothetical protein